MRNGLVKKRLVFAITVLFVGASIVPSISENIKKSSNSTVMKTNVTNEQFGSTHRRFKKHAYNNIANNSNNEIIVLDEPDPYNLLYENNIVTITSLGSTSETTNLSTVNTNRTLCLDQMHQSESYPLSWDEKNEGESNVGKQLDIERINRQKKSWTFMLYWDTDVGHTEADMTGPWVINWLETVGSNDYINILILWDKTEGGAEIYHIQKDENLSDEIISDVVKDLGEINLGDPSILKNFVNLCKVNFTAERYMLVLADHGFGYGGSCLDCTPDKTGNPSPDVLTMRETKQALVESGGVAIVGFAGCLMSCIESAFELRDCTSAYIGSEGGGGYLWNWDSIARILQDNSSESTFDIAGRIVDSFGKEIGPIDEGFQLTAIRTDMLDELVQSIEVFTKKLLKRRHLLYIPINLARIKAEHFPKMGSAKNWYVDIYHFAELITKYTSPNRWTVLHELANEVMQKVNDTVLAEYHNTSFASNAYGIGIYFRPLNIFAYLRMYLMVLGNPNYTINYSKILDFTDDNIGTEWDVFLRRYRHPIFPILYLS